MICELIDSAIDFSTIDIQFADKPIVVGGLAMEFYGIRKHGNDVDFIVSNRDYLKLEKKYRHQRKDMWGDWGIQIPGYEMFRSIYRFDYEYYGDGAIEFDRYKVISIDVLFRMKVYAMDAGEKHKNDVELLKQYFNRRQNTAYKKYLDENVNRYIHAKDGTILNGDYY
jgi:hypothetical protein